MNDILIPKYGTCFEVRFKDEHVKLFSKKRSTVFWSSSKDLDEGVYVEKTGKYIDIIYPTQAKLMSMALETVISYGGVVTAKNLKETSIFQIRPDHIQPYFEKFTHEELKTLRPYLVTAGSKFSKNSSEPFIHILPWFFFKDESSAVVWNSITRNTDDEYMSMISKLKGLDAILDELSKTE